MTNHLHMIAAAEEGKLLSDIIRDFKKFTSRRLVEAIQMENESRKQRMLYRFQLAGKYNPKVRHYKLWQEGNEAKEILTNDFLDQKLNYIHLNPVRTDWVSEPEEYLFCSASHYAGADGLVPVLLLS